LNESYFYLLFNKEGEMNMYFCGNFLFRIFFIMIFGSFINVQGMNSTELDSYHIERVQSPSLQKKLEEAQKYLVAEQQDDKSIDPYILITLSKALDLFRKETDQPDSYEDLGKMLKRRLSDNEIRCCRLRSPSPQILNRKDK